jgi:hypothetical protein
MIYKQDTTFPTTVVAKLSGRLLHALETDDVPVAKLALRSVACLCASHCVRLQGAGSITAVLDSLISIANSAWLPAQGSVSVSGAVSDDMNGDNNDSGNTTSPKELLDHQGQVAAYLVAVTIPWIANNLAKVCLLLQYCSEYLSCIYSACIHLIKILKKQINTHTHTHLQHTFLQ